MNEFDLLQKKIPTVKIYEKVKNIIWIIPPSIFSSKDMGESSFFKCLQDAIQGGNKQKKIGN